ncbi:hypothetical protein ACHAXR_010852 [Thalassiosira sp. AJA248-18]
MASEPSVSKGNGASAAAVAANGNNSSTFLAPENLCGQTLLTLVGNGHSLLADIRILSERVPSAFWAAASLSSPGGGGENKEGAKKKGDSSVNDGGSFMNNIFHSSNGATSSSSSSSSSASKYYGEMDSTPSSSSSKKNDLEEAKKYAPFLFDFSYLHNPEGWEASLAPPTKEGSNSSDDNAAAAPKEKEKESESLLELEREFAVNHRQSVEEYYELFFSIYKYQQELNRFVEDLTKGFYIQYTVESVLLDLDGRALLCEAVWLYGVMLILMERVLPVCIPFIHGRFHIPNKSVLNQTYNRDGKIQCVASIVLLFVQGPIRERLIIAYFRLFGRDGDISRIDVICKLCKSSSTTPPASASSASFSSHRTHKYPMDEDKLFNRYPLPVELIRNVVGCLVSDDIYQQSSAFPNIDHRSTRLSRQASMLYVILFFDPIVLREESAKMREIVDKYFNDNWVIHIYAGMTADLSLEWDRFPAAKSALDNVMQVGNVKRMHINNAKLIGQCMAELRAYLTMGILTDSFVLDNRHDLLNCLRRCNIAVRWRVLHRRTTNAKYHPIICAKTEEITTDPKLGGVFAVNDTHVVSLILLTSQLEMQLKEIFRELLEKKESIWISCRTKACSYMNDLAEYFKGDQTLARVSRHDGLVQWFGSMAGEIRDLAYESGDHFTVTGRKIQLCVQALEEVEQYDLVDRDVQVKAFLQEARGMLLHMARAVGINEGICEDIRWISDMSYGVESMKTYVKIIHTRVSKDPSNVSLLQGFFLKLSSSLDGPVERLKQLKSPEAARVTEYYSSQLVAFVRNVLEIVPASVFAIMVQMSDIIERRLQKLPQKVEGDKLLAYAQLGERYKLAMMAHEISIFADGILDMENTVIGSAQVNPRDLLDEGLRKELVSHVSELLNNLLQFDFSADSESVSSMSKHQAAAMRSLSSLSGRLEGFQAALECVEDYVCMHGLKLWHEELSRIMDYNVEQEVNKYLLKKVLDADSKFQSDIVPIPRFPRTPNEPSCINFMGRIVSMLIKITDCQYTTYSLEKNGWFMTDGSQVCGLKAVSLLRKAIGVYGLTGVDRLLCYRILHELHRFVKFFRTNVSKQGVLLEQLRDELFPEWKTPKNAVAIYASGSKKTEMLMLPMLTCFRRVGQAQLLRRMIRFELQRSARVDAKMLQHTVSTYNAALLSAQQPLEGQPDDIKNICDMTVAVGIGDPLETIFMKTDPLEGLPVLMLFFVINVCPKLSYHHLLGSLSKVKGGYPIDGWPIIAGISTLLKQFHPSYAKTFLAYVGQFIRVSVQTYAAKRQGKNEEASRVASDLKNSMVLVQQFCDMSGLPSSAFYSHVPQYIMEMCSELP